MIGAFFYINGDFLVHKIPVEKGEKRGGKLDNPYSHEKLYENNYTGGDYIDIPRGRVVWDIETGKAIIYIDTCIEEVDGAVTELAKLFGLDNYVIEHDEHYVCPKCIKNIWED